MATTKKRMRGPERRAQLLTVARSVFARDGYHGVTMDDVAAEAGITKPILYDHFPSKRELYLALLEADLSELRERVHSALQDSTGNRERIRGSIGAYVSFVDEHAEGFQLLMQEAIGAEREFRDMIATFRDGVMSEVADVIARESKGRVPRDEAEIVAQALIGMTETVAQQGIGRSKAERDQTIETLVRLAWRGITGLA
ncbi:MAG TPA: TetR/AcrR family transcriptional regulator [Actinomycetota bacterium]|nr:TetR/AcrR family transcriptional regulator [Actinomycetota bacterium]